MGKQSFPKFSQFFVQKNDKICEEKKQQLLHV
jgi:hypothetical protein